jgi:hypothetical protein
MSMLDPIERQKINANVAKRILEGKDQRSKQVLHLYQTHSANTLKEVDTNALSTGLSVQMNELTNMKMQQNVRGNQ